MNKLEKELLKIHSLSIINLVRYIENKRVS
jgi:hypothetical protein